MKQSHLQFKISKLLQEKTVLMTESIAIFVFSLFTSAILPSLLIRYYYANQQLTEQPKALELIPVLAFALGIGFFAYAIISAIAKKRQIIQLEQELNDLVMSNDGCSCGGACCCGDDCDHHHDHDMDELDALVEDAVKENASKKSSSDPKKMTATKSSKKK